MQSVAMHQITVIINLFILRNYLINCAELLGHLEDSDIIKWSGTHVQYDRCGVCLESIFFLFVSGTAF